IIDFARSPLRARLSSSAMPRDCEGPQRPRCDRPPRWPRGGHLRWLDFLVQACDNNRQIGSLSGNQGRTMSKKKRQPKPEPKPPSREVVMKSNERDRAIYELWKYG